MAKAVLDLLRYKGNGSPRRLFLQCDSTDKRKAVQAIGCSPVRGGFSYPPDEVAILVLKHLFGDELRMTPDCETWFNETQLKAKNLTELSQTLEADSVDVSYSEKLKPYQKACVEFAKESEKCIIGDDRGLGKTLEAITVCETKKMKNVLIVAPGYLKYGWQREIEKWTESKSILAVGERKTREALLGSFFRDNQVKYLIVNYEMIREAQARGGYPELHSFNWDAVIFDEGHRLKGRQSQWVLGAKQLKAQALMILTGNPIANRPDEIWQLLNILNPGKFTSYWTFVDYYCDCIDGFFGKEIIGVNKNHLAQLQFTLQPMLIRRLKEQVAPYLPKKVFKKIEVTLEGPQKTFYKKAEKQMILELANGGIDIIESVVTLNIRLQQALANPAILGGVNESVVEATCLELIRDLLDGGEQKVIVGLWYRKALALFLPKLEKHKIKAYVITGDVKAEERDSVMEAFKHDPKPCILIGTIQAMSEGINADECDSLIFMDKSWRPLDNDQFVDRIHRITSTRIKNYYSIVVKDSISEDREETLEQKSQMIGEILSMEALMQLTSRKTIERHKSNT